MIANAIHGAPQDFTSGIGDVHHGVHICMCATLVGASWRSRFMIGSNLLVGIDIICNDQFVASKHCSFLSDSTLETLPVPRLAQQQAQAAHDITTPHYYEHHSRKANQSIAILASSYYSEIGHFQDFIRMV
jgi:hypothetical protein